MIFLLDTDTLIYMVRGLKSGKSPKDRQRAQSLVRRCRTTQEAGDIVGLSAVTVSELEFGARASGRYEAEMQAVRKVMTPFEIYDYDAVSCPHRYGRIRHDLESRGASIGAMDLLIAAHSQALAATLVSNNRAHFSRVSGLLVVNWVNNPQS
jgi:tRNA(fMet)-specific endonuclease VapC